MKPYLYKSSSIVLDSHWDYSLYLFAKYSSNLYIAIGKDTNWNIEDIPPENFEGYSQYLEEVNIYIPVDRLSLINKSECGSFFFNNYKYHKYDIYNRQSREILDLRADLKIDRQYEALLIEVEVDLSFLPINSYRIKCLFSDVIPKEGLIINSNKNYLLKDELIDKGILHWVSYSTPTTLQSNSNIIRIVIN